MSGMAGNMVPVTMTALEGLIQLLWVLEEVDIDTRQLLLAPLVLKLTSASSAVRHQVREETPLNIPKRPCSVNR